MIDKTGTALATRIGTSSQTTDVMSNSQISITTENQSTSAYADDFKLWLEEQASKHESLRIQLVEKSPESRRAAGRELLASMERGIDFKGYKFNRDELYD